MPSSTNIDSEALFARLIKLTARREDFITECVAAVLQADAHARRRYWRRMGATLPPRIRGRIPQHIATQVSMAGGAARCDMVLHLGPMRVAVEHKLYSPQGRDQLARYLRLRRKEATHVALVAADYQPVPKRVLRNPRYLRPSSGQAHFVWADFYPVLKQAAHQDNEVARATVALFDEMGLQPCHPLIGDLNTRDSRRAGELDARLYEAWQPLLLSLQRKWEYADSSIRKTAQSQIYISYGPCNTLLGAWLDPFGNPGSLRIRLKTDSRTKQATIYERLEAQRAAIPHGRMLSIEALPRLPYKQRWPDIVEVRIAWRALLARATRATLPRTLQRFVIALMRAADRGAA